MNSDGTYVFEFVFRHVSPLSSEQPNILLLDRMNEENEPICFRLRVYKGRMHENGFEAMYK